MEILNLEMHIESRKRQSYARKKKNGYKLKSVVLILILISVFLFAYRYTVPKFDFDKYFTAVYKEGTDMARVSAYANNISVVSDDNINIDDYSPACSKRWKRGNIFKICL